MRLLNRQLEASAAWVFLAAASWITQPTNAAEAPADRFTWTDPKLAAVEDPDFLIQGEYQGGDSAKAWGLQVVAQGGGAFVARLLEGGLPGDGWEPGAPLSHFAGDRRDGIVSLQSTDGNRRLQVVEGRAELSSSNNQVVTLQRVERRSPTLGAKHPEGSLVLFDGRNADAWIGGKVHDGLLVNNDIATRERYHSYQLHLEFRTPYKPYARNQQRGNSGVYHQGRYETQVLDSFGLEPRDNHCGGVYSIAAPRMNACLPPLAWQTYDVNFVAAEFDELNQLTRPAQITVHLNGILIHDDLPLPKTTTAAPLKTISPEPGPLFLQHHNNPVYYRNIWLVQE